MTQRPDDPYGTDEDLRDDDDLFGKRERDRKQRPRAVSDFVRRAIETVGSVSQGSSVGRDAFEYLLKQGDRGRREVFRIVAHEVSDFLKNVDLSGEVVKVLSSLQVEFNATLRFKPTEDGKSVDASQSEAKVSVAPSEKPKPRPSEAPPKAPVPAAPATPVPQPLPPEENTEP